MNIQKASDSFFNSFYSNHVILYVGQGISDEDIKTYIAKCPWSAVITSRRDPEFASLFVTENRTPRDYLTRSDIPAKVLNRSSLPVFRLFGITGDQEEDDLSWLRIGEEDKTNNEYDMDSAKSMLQLLPDFLNHINPLVFVGFDSDIDWKLFGEKLNILLFNETTNGTVSFWGMPQTVSARYNKEALSRLKKVIDLKQFQCYDESLVEILKARELFQLEMRENENDIPEEDYDIYYQGRRSISISKKDLLLFKNFGELLTERGINKIRPLGRVMSRKWFSNFLESSSSLGPQWYGYLPQSDFHIKRSFEDALVKLVRKMLDGRGVNGALVSPRPIILSGDPGSSKSITLAALAYRIYNEKVNPVIFISKESFFGLSSGAGLEELDEAMQLLERKMESNTRILLIWDSSTYRAGIERARSLLDQLLNRGRRFVLVCSSYNILPTQGESIGYYKYNNTDGQFITCDNIQAQVIDVNNSYYVKAIREMNQSEIVDFWNRAKEYSGINGITISKSRKRFIEENRTEIFDYYYLLISIIRENLEQGLKTEQSKIKSYIEKELSRALGEIHAKSEQDKKSLPVYQALIAAGLEIEEFIDTEDNDNEDNNQSLMIDKKLDDLNVCIALFSRFKLSVPYGLAYTILIGEDDADQYSENTRELYRIVTNDIPWLYYGENEKGDFAFRFRNPLEADIYLSNHDFNGDKQIDLICHLIDIFGQDYRRSQCLDEAFAESLQSLLRMVGPNSEYLPFRTTRKVEHENIIGKLDVLIIKLKELKDIYGVADEDAGFASIIVTFTREYYASIWAQLYPTLGSPEEPWVSDDIHYSIASYEHRIEQLLSAITLAESSIDALEYRIRSHNINRSERNHLINQRCSLSVEIAQCNLRIENLIEEYINCCKYYGKTAKEELISRRLSYKLLYSMLMPVITSEPTNGYAYNTLFRAFRRVYEKGNLSNAKKLQYLSEIMQVVEACEALDTEISSRGSQGNDELTQHINYIKDYRAGFKITLDSVQRHRKGIQPYDDDEKLCFELYDEMLEDNNAAAITFVCQKELQLPKGTRALNEDQLERSKKVFNFLMEEDNYECVSTNTYALSMLIRVTWMVFNKTTLTHSPECQLTKLKRTEWQKLYQLCQQYDIIVGERKDPLIILLFALSILQVNGLRKDSFIEAVDLLGTLDESLFYQRRMWTPFMLCDENGYPYKYSGTVISTKPPLGFMQVNGVPRNLNKDVGIRFRQYNLGRRRRMPEERDVLSQLELGIGYTGFSVYTEEGRKEKEARS